MLHLHQVLHRVKIIPGQEGNVMEPFPAPCMVELWLLSAILLLRNSNMKRCCWVVWLLGQWLQDWTVFFFSGRQLGHTVLNESRFWMCILCCLQIVPFCLQSLHKPKRSKKTLVGHFLMSFTLFLFLHYSLGHLCKHIRHSPAFS